MDRSYEPFHLANGRVNRVLLPAAWATVSLRVHRADELEAEIERRKASIKKNGAWGIERMEEELSELTAIHNAINAEYMLGPMPPKWSPEGRHILRNMEEKKQLRGQGANMGGREHLHRVTENTFPRPGAAKPADLVDSFMETQLDHGPVPGHQSAREFEQHHTLPDRARN